MENVRIERRETRDLLQDLRDVEDGIEVVHASDLEKAAEAQKREAKEKRREYRERRRERKSLPEPEAEAEQMSLF